MKVVKELRNLHRLLSLQHFLILFFILLQFIRSGSSLQCYTCEAEDSNENCLGLNTVRTCSRTQDRCLTQTIYSKERGKLRIDKSCASQMGCAESQVQLDKRYYCDTSRAGWGCLECCNTDRCNESSAVQTQASAGLLVLVVGMVMVLLRVSSR